MERENPGVLRHNLIANTMDGALFAFAMSFVSLQTVLPVFVKRIGGSNFAVALIPVIWTAGFNFPQIFIANYVERFPLKKQLFLRTAFMQRVPWLLLTLLSFFAIDELNPAVGVSLFLLLLMLAAIAGAVNFPIWFDLITKLTPVDLRGRLLASRNLFGAVLGVFGGWIVQQILGGVSYPTSYGVLFALAVACMALSFWALTEFKEERPSVVSQRVRLLEYYKSLPGILRKHGNFRNFLISDALLIAATMAGAFYAIHPIEKFSLEDSSVGTFTIVIMCGMIVGNIFFGYVADRYGHKLNLILSAGSTAVACFVALLAPTPALYLIVFVGLAFQIGLSGISRLSIVAELCSEEERPTYVALTNLVTSPFVLFGVIAGGIATRYGYEAVFVIAGSMAVSSAIWLIFKVQEPRGMSRQSMVQSVQYES